MIFPRVAYYKVAASVSKCCLVALVVMASKLAIADDQDVFNTVISSSYTHDSNLFRLPSGVDPRGSGSDRSDNILNTSLGVRIRKNYSLQSFQVDYSHTQNKYDNNSYLNFDSNAYKVAWLWSITPYLKGNLSADRTEALVPFIDFRNTNTQNIRTTETQAFDFDWSPHNNWHLLGRYMNLSSVNTQTFLPETSFNLDIVQGGIKYVFPSDSFVSFTIQDGKGQNQTTNFANLIGRTFDEKQEEIKAQWILTAKSIISSNFGHIRRMDNDFSQRDFSAYFGGLNYNWDITGKTSLLLSLTRKASSFTDTTSSYSILDSLNINPTWNATSKIAVKGIAQLSRRRFLGNGPIFSAVDREDDGVTYGIGIDWVPRNTIKFGLNFTRDTRDSNSNLVNGIDRDYSANTVTLNGQLIF